MHGFDVLGVQHTVADSDLDALKDVMIEEAQRKEAYWQQGRCSLTSAHAIGNPAYWPFLSCTVLHDVLDAIFASKEWKIGRVGGEFVNGNGDVGNVRCELRISVRSECVGKRLGLLGLGAIKMNWAKELGRG